MKPTKSKHTVLNQICKIIPASLVNQLTKKHGIDKQSRSFSSWSHIVSMIHAQLANSISLNDVSDALKNHSGSLAIIRGAKPPSRNGLSHANKIRSADMSKDLFWGMFKHIQDLHPNFGHGHNYSGLPRRFKRAIFAIDSTTIQLVANCMEWAKHRRQKAAAKCHMSLNMQTFLPQFAIVKAAKTHDSTEAVELCAHLKNGEIALFDRAYVDYNHLNALDKRGVFWVTRAKSNMNYKVVESSESLNENITQDSIIELATPKSHSSYSKKMRLIEAYVEVNGKAKKMTFITNNFSWSPQSICDLYKCRWGIEVFFKQIKQTLQLKAFLGNSENAVKWQVWIAMLTYLLLRYLNYLGKWKGSFRRLYTLVRGVLFSRLNVLSVLESCGTAGGRKNTIPPPKQLIIPGFRF